MNLEAALAAMGKDKSPKPMLILQLHKKFQAKKLDLNPRYQRRSVWTRYQDRLLIDSLLRGYDVPKLYFRRIDEGPFEYEVADGQQRLKAVFEYLDDQYALEDDADPVEGEVVAKKRYGTLPAGARDLLDQTSLDVIVLTGYTDEEVQDMFIRLQNGTPLNAPEKRRAYPGSMKDVVAKLAKHRFYKLVGFGNNRGAHEDAASKVLHMMLIGGGKYVDIKPASIKRTYQLNKAIDEENPTCKRYIRSLNFIAKAFVGKTPKFAKFEAITLPMVVDGLLPEYNLADFPKEFSAAYMDFEAKRLHHMEMIQKSQVPEDQIIRELIDYTEDARNDSTASMEARDRMIRRVILAAIPSLKPLAPNRLFDEDQKFVLHHRDGGKCKQCGKVVSSGEWQADHIIPHSKGGQTSIENGQVLCNADHIAKTNMQIKSVST